MPMRIQVFGPLRVLADDARPAMTSVPGRTNRQVLQILAAHSGRPVSKDRLVDLLWESGPPDHPRQVVEHHVAEVRRGLYAQTPHGDTVVRCERAGYRLDLDRVSIDLAEFKAAVDDLSTWLHLDRVRHALELSERELFEDEPDADWAVETRREVRRRRCDLLVRAAELDLAAGDPLAAVRDAGDALGIEPHLEAAHRVLVCAYYVCGEPGLALSAYRTCRDRLVDDCGVEPSPHTRSVHEAVFRGLGVADVMRRLTVPQGLRTA